MLDKVGATRFAYVFFFDFFVQILGDCDPTIHFGPGLRPAEDTILAAVATATSRKVSVPSGTPPALHSTSVCFDVKLAELDVHQRKGLTVF